MGFNVIKLAQGTTRIRFFIGTDVVDVSFKRGDGKAPRVCIKAPETIKYLIDRTDEEEQNRVAKLLQHLHKEVIK